MLRINSKGDFKNMEKFLKTMDNTDIFDILDSYGRQGVNALRSQTPRDSGISAESWSYRIVKKRDFVSITWHNDHVVDGVPVVILLQYGHGTGTGGYVQGQDFINPAIRSTFKQISEGVWKAVINS